MMSLIIFVIFFILNIRTDLACSVCMEPAIVIHGGSGIFTDDAIHGKINGMQIALERGYKTLMRTGSSLNAVEEAVRSMEEDPFFNAGYGSVLTSEGKVEMDASIMNGAQLRAGCLSVVKDILHPISLARLLMEKTNTVYLAGNYGTRKFAIEQGIEILPPGALIPNKTHLPIHEYKPTGVIMKEEHLPWRIDNVQIDRNFGEGGTVGAVAIDQYGNITAATSTGGIKNKPPGRVGDSPILGSGTYSDNNIGGISATGDGEYLMRFNIAQQILQRIKYENMTAQQATKDALLEMDKRLPIGKGAAITIDYHGNIGIYSTYKNVAWAYRQGDNIKYGVSIKDLQN